MLSSSFLLAFHFHCSFFIVYSIYLLIWLFIFSISFIYFIHLLTLFLSISLMQELTSNFVFTVSCLLLSLVSNGTLCLTRYFAHFASARVDHYLHSIFPLTGKLWNSACFCIFSSHHYSVHFTNARVDCYLQSFFPFTGQLGNSSCFSLDPWLSLLCSPH